MQTFLYRPIAPEIRPSAIVGLASLPRRKRA
jgi:hypothetical protein